MQEKSLTVQSAALKKLLADILGFLTAFLAVAAAASLGGFFSPGDWYRTLEKPTWNPPDWIFGPVWSFLYLSMAIAGGLLWVARSHKDKPVIPALLLFFGQLLLNALWTPLFFGLHWMGIAALEIVALNVTIFACCIVFWKVNRVASALFWPYWAWVTFASVLNITLFLMNS